MQQRDFEEWLKTFRVSIATYQYYVDFSKVYSNVKEIKVELNILNSLIGSQTIEEDFRKLATKYPEILKCIPILLAVRSREIFADNRNFVFNEDMDIDDASLFLRETGLFDLMSEHITKDLVDYVTGIETGLDSNARKNRGGDLMEDLVESFIKKAGFVANKDYFKEMTSKEIETKWGIDLSALTNDQKAKKRFDFVIKTEEMIYAIEANFYASGGSKLNETARSYKMIAEEARSISGFSFIWITDGLGWESAKRNLEETFDDGANIYNISELDKGLSIFTNNE